MMRLLNRFRGLLHTASTDDTATPVTTDDAYSIVQNARRRNIIEFLVTQDGDEFEVREIVDYLAAELGEDRTTAWISIVQHHAPRLHEIGYVDYDDRAKTMRVHSSVNRLYEAHTAFTNELN